MHYVNVIRETLYNGSEEVSTPDPVERPQFRNKLKLELKLRGFEFNRELRRSKSGRAAKAAQAPEEPKFIVRIEKGCELQRSGIKLRIAMSLLPT